MRVRNHAAAAAVLCGLLAAAPAQATTYLCNLKPAGSRDVIPPDLSVTFEEGSSKAMVFDGLIKAEVGKPIEGTLRSANATRLLFGWTVPRISNDSGQYAAGFTYSLNIVLATGAAQITGNPQGYSNKWRGSGTCKKK